jgi:Nrap protein domain 6
MRVDDMCTLMSWCSLPAEVVRERGAKRLRRELLVGFEPVPLFVALLERHFGNLAAFFYDGFGGRAIGLRWQGLLLPAVHAFAAPPACDEVLSNDLDVLYVDVDASHAGRWQNGALNPQSAAAGLPAALAQMFVLGAGLVQDVLLVAGRVTPAWEREDGAMYWCHGRSVRSVVLAAPVLDCNALYMLWALASDKLHVALTIISLSHTEFRSEAIRSNLARLTQPFVDRSEALPSFTCNRICIMQHLQLLRGAWQTVALAVVPDASL